MKTWSLKSPRYRTRPSPVLESVNDFDKEVIRRDILAYYERGELPTLASLFQRVKEPPVNFKGGRTSLRTLLKHLGFRFKKHGSNKAIMMERPDVVAARHKFLRELAVNRRSESPRPEIYLDDTWVSENASGEQTNKDGQTGLTPKPAAVAALSLSTREVLMALFPEPCSCLNPRLAVKVTTKTC